MFLSTHTKPEEVRARFVALERRRSGKEITVTVKKEEEEEEEEEEATDSPPLDPVWH